MKNIRWPVVAAWSVSAVVAVLVGLLAWLLLGQPSYLMGGGHRITCRPILVEVGTGPQGTVDITGVDSGRQSARVRTYAEGSTGYWHEIDKLTARIAVSQACQDARLNRQTAAGLTAAALVMVTIPASLCGIRRLSGRVSRPPDSTRHSA